MASLYTAKPVDAMYRCLQAKGPTVAREKVASMYKNEDIFMQIDSHSKLAQDWDNKAVAMLAR